MGEVPRLSTPTAACASPYRHGTPHTERECGLVLCHSQQNAWQSTDHINSVVMFSEIKSWKRAFEAKEKGFQLARGISPLLLNQILKVGPGNLGLSKPSR